MRLPKAKPPAKMVLTTIRLNPQMVRKIDAKAKAAGMSRSVAIRYILEKALEQ